MASKSDIDEEEDDDEYTEPSSDCEESVEAEVRLEYCTAKDCAGGDGAGV